MRVDHFTASESFGQTTPGAVNQRFVDARGEDRIAHTPISDRANECLLGSGVVQKVPGEAATAGRLSRRY
jgi:hypothetical protein